MFRQFVSLRDFAPKKSVRASTHNVYTQMRTCTLRDRWIVGGTSLRSRRCLCSLVVSSARSWLVIPCSSFLRNCLLNNALRWRQQDRSLALPSGAGIVQLYYCRRERRRERASEFDQYFPLSIAMCSWTCANADACNGQISLLLLLRTKTYEKPNLESEAHPDQSLHLIFAYEARACYSAVHWRSLRRLPLDQKGLTTEFGSQKQY